MSEIVVRDYASEPKSGEPDHPPFTTKEGGPIPRDVQSSIRNQQKKQEPTMESSFNSFLPWVCIALGVGIFINYGDNGWFKTFGAFTTIYGVANVINPKLN